MSPLWVQTTITAVINGGACKHGFLPRHSKTDNFKVKQVPIREIDVVFLDPTTWQPMPGFKATWIDQIGGSNVKWSYFLPQWNIIEAHVEAVEDGEHTIVIEDGVIGRSREPLDKGSLVICGNTSRHISSSTNATPRTAASVQCLQENNCRPN